MQPRQVALLVYGVEDELCAKRLEAGIIAVGRAVVILDVFHLDLRLVLFHEAVYYAVAFRDGEAAVGRDAACLSLQIGQLQAEQANRVASAAALHTIAERHTVQACRHANRLRAVYGEVDALPAYAEAVELGIADGFFCELKRPVLLQSDAVDSHSPFAQRQVFQVEHRVGSPRDVALNTERFPLLAPAKHQGRKKYII